MMRIQKSATIPAAALALFLLTGCIGEQSTATTSATPTDPENVESETPPEPPQDQQAVVQAEFESVTLKDTEIRGPVTIKFLVDREKSNDDELELVVSVDCEFGWHTYARVGSEGAFQVTTVELEGLDELEVTRELAKPRGTPYRKQPGTLIYRGLSEFRCRIKIPEMPKHLIAKVKFQTCNDATCLPPEEVSVKIRLGE